MNDINENLSADDFVFDLPDNLIALHPASPRDSARLLQVKADGALIDGHVRDLTQLLCAGDVLVLNDTKVLPARLRGIYSPSNCKTEKFLTQNIDNEWRKQKNFSCFQSDTAYKSRKIEVLLDRRISNNSADNQKAEIWHVMARGAKRLHSGASIDFGHGLATQVLGRSEDGLTILSFNLAGIDLMQWLELHGEIPLPPYINRQPTADDRANYQTVYAHNAGAVAAPTAGLHFTNDMMASIKARGVDIVHITLHVGAGTFRPVHAGSLKDHKMHAEWGCISQEAVDIINNRRGRLVAVGTTSLRLLESAAYDNGLVQPFSGTTNIFIYPGVRIRTADILITNFHLPRSTLLMLVSAFAGRAEISKAYNHAVSNNYKFYSYGDAMWLERRHSQK